MSAASTPPPRRAQQTPLPDRDGISEEERALGQAFRERYAHEVQDVVVHRVVPAPRATLAVVSYRAGDYLLDCLRNLRGQSVAGEVPYEILLVDNGGLEHLRHRFRNLVDVELRMRRNVPLGAARNSGTAWGRGELVAHVDDDGLVSPEWLERALEAFEDPAIRMARGRIVAHRHRYFNTFAVHYDLGDALTEDNSLGTEGNMIARRLAYLAADGFPDLVQGGEGLCMVYRMKQMSPASRSVYVPGMRMEHDYCRTAQEFIWKCRRYRSSRQDDPTAGDPGLRAFLEEYRRRKKPVVHRTWDEVAALRTLRAASWAIERMPFLDRVRRR